MYDTLKRDGGVCGRGRPALTPRISVFDREMGKDMVEGFDMKKDVKN